MASTRDPPEIRHASRLREMNKKLEKTAAEQDKKSAIRQRQIDRNIYLTTKDLHDINARTPNTPHITVSSADNNDNDNNSDHFGSPRTVCSSDGCDSDSDTHLVHLRSRTRRNMLLSQKLSRSLEVMTEKRERSPQPSASKERRPYRPVSSRSMEDLKKAACVLKNTEHEGMVQQLLSSVSVKSK
nr:hypothetical protein BaRGS_026303 [Batillaria attramentaria]